MERKEYRLAALDMDGTLLDSQQRIAPEAVRVIRQILQNGRQVVPVTGRCMGEMGEYLELFPEMRYLVCENGACIYDLQKGEAVSLHPVKAALAGQILEQVEREDVVTALFIGNRSFMDAGVMGSLGEFGLERYQGLFRRSVVCVDGLYDFYRAKPLDAEKINLFFRDEDTRRRVNFKISALPVTRASSLAGNLELTASGVNKGSGLRELCGLLEIPLESVIAIGDSSNDEQMLDAAGLPVVMGNAASSLRRPGRMETLDCDHGGAVVILEKYML